ncbi:MAG TPA: hypothetical protein VMU45_03265 [Candidatus Eisenbacteria bacterium]|nr:hypothetical protein [Candidatus Eisenbacteria bacterium]
MSMMSQRVLVIYSAVVSTVLGVVLLTGAIPQKMQSFDEIRVQRIDVVEPDGTLRMVISNRDRLPGVIVKGKQSPPNDRPQAGMIFYNDEGSENGGLIFGGRKNEKGEVVDSGGSLSFDKYGENQIVQLAGVDDKSDKLAGLAVSDQNRRVWVGRTGDGVAAVALMDAKGKKRIVMQVTPEGVPSLSFLDGSGKVVREVSGEAH